MPRRVVDNANPKGIGIPLREVDEKLYERVITPTTRLPIQMVREGQEQLRIKREALKRDLENKRI